MVAPHKQLAKPSEERTYALIQEKKRREKLVAQREAKPGADAADEERWPALQGAALHGLAGDVVRTIAPHTESSSVAILVQLLVAFGNCVGRSPFWTVEADRHWANLFVALVGDSAKARKGTAWGWIRKLFLWVDHEWVSSRVMSGLSSGEGLLYQIRDPAPVQDDKDNTDEGVKDKRLLAFEGELASILRVLERDGNTLSAHLRNAWDGLSLQTLTKNSPIKVTDPHVSIIGHITRDELRRYLTRTESGNGFANRFLFFLVRRSKELPFGGDITDEQLRPISERLARAVQHARRVNLVGMDEEARAMWPAAYSDLTADRPGMLGAVTSRAEAQARRLAMLYALLDEDDMVRPPHLEAALDLIRYAIESAELIFGASLGDPDADKILEALRAAPDGMTRTEIRDLFGRNKSKGNADRALNLLLRYRYVRVEQRPTRGRPEERWFCNHPTTKTT